MAMKETPPTIASGALDQQSSGVDLFPPLQCCRVTGSEAFTPKNIPLPPSEASLGNPAILTLGQARPCRPKCLYTSTVSDH